MNKYIKKKFVILIIITLLVCSIIESCNKDKCLDYRGNIIGNYSCKLVIEENRYSYSIHDTIYDTTTNILLTNYLDSFILISDPLLYYGQNDTVKVRYSILDKSFQFYLIHNSFNVGYYNYITGNIKDLPIFINRIHMRPPAGPPYSTYYYYGIKKII